MDENQPTHLTDDQIKEFLALTSPNHFKNSLPTFTPETITRIYQSLSSQQTKKAASLAFNGVEALKEVPLLEAAGKGVSAALFLEFFSLNSRKRKKPLDEKISPLLVGLPQESFRQALFDAPTEHLGFFKQEGVAEPMQHHLLLLTHEIDKENNQFLTWFSSIQKEIEALSPEMLTQEEIETIQEKIHDLSMYYEQTIDLLDKALAIAWNSNRPDIIDQLTSAKETAHRQNWLGVGEHSDRVIAPYSLQAILESHLEAIYGEPEEPEALLDTDPAIEGLAKLSLWYLSDYVSLGILTPFTHEEHELPPEIREELLGQAQDNLAKLGLETVKDLKEAGIFSQQILHDYIQKQTSLAR